MGGGEILYAGVFLSQPSLLTLGTRNPGEPMAGKEHSSEVFCSSLKDRHRTYLNNSLHLTCALASQATT